MTSNIQTRAPKIWEKIENSTKILLHCHPNPDPDSAGGVLASKFVLESLGKKVTVIWGDSPPPDYLKSLPGFKDILPRNLTDIDLKDFDLFIIQDSSSKGMITKLAEVTFPDNLSTVIIDHHASNTGYAEVNLIEPSYISTCQILFDLFKLWKVNLTPEICTNLFAGIYFDSGGFKYPLVTKETFLTAAELVNYAPEFSKVIFEIENSDHPKSIEYMGILFSNIEHYFSGKVALCWLTLDQLKQKNIPLDIVVSELSNTIKSAIGNDIAITLTESEPDVFRVSMRRRVDTYDLSKIAVATGSGGGHVAAAGATLKMPLHQAKAHMLETIRSVYPELGQP